MIMYVCMYIHYIYILYTYAYIYIYIIYVCIYIYIHIHNATTGKCRSILVFQSWSTSTDSPVLNSIPSPSGGFHGHGGTPIAAWFQSENPIKMDDN